MRYTSISKSLIGWAAQLAISKNQGLELYLTQMRSAIFCLTEKASVYICGCYE